MPEHAKHTPAPWHDEFTQPTLAALLDGLEPSERPAFESALAMLKSRRGCRDRIEWQGLPWRWAVCISQPGLGHPALAYLIAKPADPFVCIPVPIEGDLAPDPALLTKPVRARLDQAPIIAGYLWPEWPVADLDPVAISPLLDARGGDES